MNIKEILKEEVLVLDGAMGTLLYSMGIAKGHCYDELNLSDPMLIREIHKGYILAGADIIKTNTFGANRAILETYFDLGNKCHEINLMGARLAREEADLAKKKVFVAGSIGPVTRPLEQDTGFSDNELHEIFSEQAIALAQGCVDVFLLETFGDPHEASIAFNAIKRRLPTIPIIVLHSFTQEGQTIFGYAPKDVVFELKTLRAEIAGVNCSIGPQNALDALRTMSNVFPNFLAIAPNAGRPKFIDGEFIYPASPEYFGLFARQALAMGANIIGGCCGTNYEHIEAISNAIGKKKPKGHKTISLPRKVGSRKHEKVFQATSFLEKLNSDKEVITVEIDPPRAGNVQDVREAVSFLENLGIDGLNIADMPLARLRMSALSLAAYLKTITELDIILHVTARDRNLIALQSDLLGANALGINDILALRGDPPSVGDYPFATGVFDVDTTGLVSIVRHLNKGEDRLGNSLQSQTNICVGVAFNPGLPKLDRELQRLEKKLSKGAHFIQTQPIFDIEVFNSLEKMPKLPIVASILPLWSLRNAIFLRNEVPGIYIPDIYIQRMQEAKEPSLEGAKISAEIMDSISDKVAGFCVIPPFGKYKILEKIACFRSN